MPEADLIKELIRLREVLQTQVSAYSMAKIDIEEIKKDFKDEVARQIESLRMEINLKLNGSESIGALEGAAIQKDLTSLDGRVAKVETKTEKHERIIWIGAGLLTAFQIALFVLTLINSAQNVVGK